jgi:type II secretory pathway component PulC
MEKYKLRHKLSKEFLKYCPECKIYHPSALKKCPICKKVLRSFFLKYYATARFKELLCFFIIFSLFLYGTYGIQVKERTEYKQGFNLLINKKFRVGWEKVKGALIKNPLYNYLKPLIGISKGKAREVKKEYVLKEIYFDTDRRNSAMINDKIVFEGDSMGGFKIIKISKDSVDIETNGVQENIKFCGTWN